MKSSPLPKYPLSPPVNLRDLGGISVPNGQIRTGFVWRADDLSLTDELSTHQLVHDGLTAIIDLRSHFEAENTGRGLLGQQSVMYHHVPLWSSLSPDLQAGSDWDQSRFAQLYINLFENASAQIVTSLAIIAHSPGTVAFHCSAGQDRTGVLSAALLLALGASSDDIVADYVVTGTNSVAVRERIAPVLAPVMAQMGVQVDESARAALRKDFSSTPMTALLDHLHTGYRDPLEPLYRAGLSDSLIERLQQTGVGHG